MICPHITRDFVFSRQNREFELPKNKAIGKTINSKPKKLQKAVFLDRDGTICEEANYLSDPDELRLYPFAADAIKLFRAKGFLTILITNQSGIGRGFLDAKTLNEIHKRLAAILAAQKTGLDAIYFCPHVPEDGCRCRKPGSGMIEKAFDDLAVDLKESWVIGDKASDIETGSAAGLHTAMVLTGYGQAEIERLPKPPDIIGDDLLEIARKITG